MPVRDLLSAASGVGGADDPYFYANSLLLNGDGTNGAQNNTFLDSSTNNFTITRNGNTTQGSFSPYGTLWSNYFNGSSNLVTSSSQVIPSGSYTLEAMVFVTSSSATQTIFAQGTGTGDSARTFLGIEDNSGAKWAIQIGGTQAISSVTPVLNTWHYVAMTFNGSTMTLYLNGTSIASASASTNASNTTLQIGKNWGTYWFNGYISNARVSNTVRTIGAAPTAPFSVDGNTVFLSCQANRFRDASSNNYALSVQNGSPSVQRFSPFNPTATYDPAVIGGSGYFGSTSSYLTTPSNAAFNMGSGDFTIEGWVYITSFSSQYNTVVCQWNSSPAWYLYVTSTGVRCGTYISGSVTAITGSATVNLNTWNHVAGVRNGSTLTVYMNGVSIGSTSISGSLASSSDAVSVAILGDGSGGYNSTTSNIGYTSDVRVIKGTALYTGSTYTIPTAPLAPVTNTSLLNNFINAGISDLAMQNNLETVGNAQVSTSVKKYGTGSLAFDGTGDYLTALNIPPVKLQTGDFTIECWAYFTSVSSGVILDKRNGSTRGILIYFGSSGMLSLAAGDSDSSAWEIRFDKSSITTSTWYHVAFVRSGNNFYGFVDGTQISASQSSSMTIDDVAANFYIGAFGDGSTGLSGNIDDLRISKFARYTANFTPPTAALPTF
jgi:hypothetical protein